MAASGQHPNELPEVLEFVVGDELIGIRGGVLFRASTDVLPAGGGGSGIREDVTFTSGSIVADASVSGTVSISPRYQLLQITTNYPCRVRLYTSTAKRDADLTRPIGTDPEGNHGLLFEFVTTSSLLAADLSPVVDGFSATSSVAYHLTNLDTVTRNLSITLNHVKTGA